VAANTGRYLVGVEGSDQSVFAGVSPLLPLKAEEQQQKEHQQEHQHQHQHHRRLAGGITVIVAISMHASAASAIESAIKGSNFAANLQRAAIEEGGKATVTRSLPPSLMTLCTPAIASFWFWPGVISKTADLVVDGSTFIVDAPTADRPSAADQPLVDGGDEGE
jgi:hypothetical protein